MGAKRVLICGGRGGVGAGFVAANLALALRHAQKRVLLIDASPLRRTLDAYFSCEEDVVYDLSDLCAGRAPVADLLLTPPRVEGLSLVAAPFSSADMPSGKQLHAALDRLCDDFDVILIDTLPLPCMLSGAAGFDLCCVVADPTEAALRGAERAGHDLQTAGCADVRTVINRFSFRRPGDTGQATALSMVDTVHLPLLGLLPPLRENELYPPRTVEEYPLLGNKKPYKHDPARVAFANIAARLLGEQVLLLHGIRSLRRWRKTLLY